MKSIKLFVAVFLFLGISISSFAQKPDKIDVKIARMMELQGTTQQMEQVFDQMMDIQKNAVGDAVDDEFWSELKKEISKDAFKELIDLVVPIYKKHLSESEIDAIIAFYESEAGQSLLKKSPLIMAESMQVGATWGQALAEKILSKMEDAEED